MKTEILYCVSIAEEGTKYYFTSMEDAKRSFEMTWSKQGKVTWCNLVNGDGVRIGYVAQLGDAFLGSIEREELRIYSSPQHF